MTALRRFPRSLRREIFDSETIIIRARRYRWASTSMGWVNFRCTPRERDKVGKTAMTFRAIPADPRRESPFLEFNKNPKASEIEIAVAEEHYAFLLSPRYALPSSILFRFTFPIALLVSFSSGFSLVLSSLHSILLIFRRETHFTYPE